MAVSQPADGRL